jgi:hypothetical protein
MMRRWGLLNFHKSNQWEKISSRTNSVEGGAELGSSLKKGLNGARGILSVDYTERGGVMAAVSVVYDLRFCWR